MDPKTEAEDTGAETALLPKSIFGQKNPEPGSTCSFRVVRVYEEEVEVEYVSEKKEEKKEATPEEQLDAMAMPGELDRM